MSISRLCLANALTSGTKELKAYNLAKIRSGPLVTLETFWKTKEITKLLDANPDIQILLDSGAHSLLNAMVGLRQGGETVKAVKKDKVEFDAEAFQKLGVNQRINYASKKGGAAQFFADWSFNKSADVKKYLDNYIAFIHKYKKQLWGYVNLDIIYNAEESWENQKYMESNGLRPIPVFHYGEDFKWLRKYVDEYEYIGIGGVAGGITLQQFVVSLGDKAFDYIKENKWGLKVHGFAVTSTDLMKKYPWYSCDSTTWILIAAYGGVFSPRVNSKNEFDYSQRPLTVFVSDISLMKSKKSNPHYTLAYTKEEVEKIDEYFKMAGTSREKLKVSMFERAKTTVYYFEQLMKSGCLSQSDISKSSKTFF